MLEVLMYSFVDALDAVETMSVVGRACLDEADVDDFFSLTGALRGSERPRILLSNHGVHWSIIETW